MYIFVHIIPPSNPISLHSYTTPGINTDNTLRPNAHINVKGCIYIHCTHNAGSLGVPRFVQRCAKPHLKSIKDQLVELCSNS